MHNIMNQVVTDSAEEDIILAATLAYYLENHALLLQTLISYMVSSASANATPST